MLSELIWPIGLHLKADWFLIGSQYHNFELQRFAHVVTYAVCLARCAWWNKVLVTTWEDAPDTPHVDLYKAAAHSVSNQNWDIIIGSNQLLLNEI